jgi:hypothetical protein
MVVLRLFGNFIAWEVFLDPAGFFGVMTLVPKFCGAEYATLADCMKGDDTRLCVAKNVTLGLALSLKT